MELIRKLYKGNLPVGECFIMVLAIMLGACSLLVILDYAVTLTVATKSISYVFILFTIFIMMAILAWGGICLFKCARHASGKARTLGKAAGVIMTVAAVWGFITLGWLFYYGHSI